MPLLNTVSREIDTIQPQAIRYSICTLVTNPQEYAALVDEFIHAGFTTEACEYIFVDNSIINKYDAYEAYNKFILSSRGSYVILCHQDIVLGADGRRRLDTIINEIDKIDASWAVLGNAGGNADGHLIARISDPHGIDQNNGPFPAKVESVDENFVVIKRAANLALSHDLTGFHFYAADLCIIATILGYSIYVVDFHLYHKSGGSKTQPFYDARRALLDKYAAALRPRWLRTTCEHVYISNKSLRWRLFNLAPSARLARHFPKTIRQITTFGFRLARWI